MSRISIHYVIAFVLLTLYGGQVCPFIESLSLAEWGASTFVVFSIIYLLQIFILRNRSIEDDISEGTGRAAFKILMIFLLSAVILSIFNMIYYHFPITSGLKLVFGWLLIGLLMTLDLHISRRLEVMMHLASTGRNLEITQGYPSLTKRFIIVAITLTVSLLMVIFLVIIKDLDWLLFSSQSRMESVISILKEFLFIFGVILGYLIVIIRSYSKNLKYYLACQNTVLDDVIDGNLNTAVPVTSEDEFGWMAYQTNKMIESLKIQTDSLQLTQDVAILSLASLAEARDNETGAHIMRTQRYVKALAVQLKENPQFSDELTDRNIDLIYKSAPLHDMGKVGIPDSILLKPGKLTDEEFQIMKRHPNYARKALQGATQKLGDNSFMKYAVDIAFTHHEKWDGSGYPRKLKGEDIPLCGRLMAVADVYDALISKRVYKDAMTHEMARDIIVKDAGTHFDPKIVEAFLAVEDEFIEIAKEFSEKSVKTVKG